MSGVDSVEIASLVYFFHDDDGMGGLLVQEKRHGFLSV
jgi:hypothetical protein